MQFQLQHKVGVQMAQKHVDFTKRLKGVRMANKQKL
jgi:hypothetical protein